MRIRVLFCMFVISVFACASMQTSGTGLESNVRAYWNAKVAEDYGKAYAYEQMSLSERTNREDYIKNILRHGIKIKSFEILDIHYEDENRALVMMEVISAIPPVGKLEVKKPLRNVFQDTWIRMNGKWYHVIKKIGGQDIQFLNEIKSLPKR